MSLREISRRYALDRDLKIYDREQVNYRAEEEKVFGLLQRNRDLGT